MDDYDEAVLRVIQLGLDDYLKKQTELEARLTRHEEKIEALAAQTEALEQQTRANQIPEVSRSKDATPVGTMYSNPPRGHADKWFWDSKHGRAVFVTRFFTPDPPGGNQRSYAEVVYYDPRGLGEVPYGTASVPAEWLQKIKPAFELGY